MTANQNRPAYLPSKCQFIMLERPVAQKQKADSCRVGSLLGILGNANVLPASLYTCSLQLWTRSPKALRTCKTVRCASRFEEDVHLSGTLRHNGRLRQSLCMHYSPELLGPNM